MIQKKNNKYVFHFDSNKHCINVMPDWSLFDKIYCIHYLPYADRLNNIKQQLKDVGIIDLPQFEFYYTTENRYNRLLLNNPTFNNNEIYDYNINLTFDSYRLLQICSMYNRVLIIEDDAKFIKDIRYIKSCIDHFPLDYDIVSFEYFVPNMFRNTFKVKCIQNNNYYYEADGAIFDTSCISFTKKACEYITYKQHNCIRPFDHYTFYKKDSSKIKTCISKKKLNVQSIYENCQESDLATKQKQEKLELDAYKVSNIQNDNIIEDIPVVISYFTNYHLFVDYFIHQLNRCSATKFYNIKLFIMHKHDDKNNIDVLLSKYKNSNVIINAIEIDKYYDFHAFKSKHRIFDETAIYRLFIPLFEQLFSYHYALYFDVDMYLNIDCDFPAMVNAAKNSKYLAARKTSTDNIYFGKDDNTFNDYSNYIAKLGKFVFGDGFVLKDNDTLINSGMLAINLDGIDKTAYSDLLYFILRKMAIAYDIYPTTDLFKYPDQDVICLLFSNIDILDPKFNFKQWYWKNKYDWSNKVNNITFNFINKCVIADDVHVVHFQGNQQGKMKPELQGIISTDRSFIQ